VQGWLGLQLTLLPSTLTVSFSFFLSFFDGTRV
jgi:hypothetical protein